ncbi:MAG: aminoacyl-histidine dipeptidase [Butyricicoccus sp.]
MAVLAGLQPERVFHYFEELCAIPHGSGDTKRISDYCVRFAQQHGLRYIQDDSNNIILFQDGTPGYKQSEPVMLQGHLDMVCEKTADCPIDFSRDGLILQVKDGNITADGTTLGGDDGIAVAYALAILDAKDIPHPPLEVVFTVDEEIGMLGAAALDATPLRSRTMLNLDSEDEGYLLVSCAGGVRVTCHLPVDREETEKPCLTLTISGLTGGHSGVEIDKERANSNQLMGRLLNELNKAVPFFLVSVDGGRKDNAIPRETTAVIAAEDAERVQDVVARYQAIFQNEYRVTDPELTVTMQPLPRKSVQAMDAASQKRAIAALLHLPGGVQRMSADMEGLVQTSLNLGILETLEREIQLSFAVRSSVGTEKQELVSRIANLMDVLGGTVDCAGDYPAWEYRRDSRLRELMVEVFEEQYGHKPVVQALHAGVECGLFAGKLSGLDCVSFGPDMTDIHTTSECMSIASVQRTWAYLLEILKRLR